MNFDFKPVMYVFPATPEDDLESDYPNYCIDGKCWNCGREYQMIVRKGREAPRSPFAAECPSCGCNKVNAP